MGLSPYLAMTAAEMAAADPLPPNLAYMACHFSPYGTGLSNLPDSLPKGSMLIVNDRTPVFGHDPQLIIRQLQQAYDALECRGILLDFQRPDCPETAALSTAIVSVLPQTAVSDVYAKDMRCPVFLPPPPLRQPLQEYLSPWQDREIWLEAATDAELVTITADGSLTTPIPCMDIPENAFYDSALHCCYRTEVFPDEVRIYVYRTEEQLEGMLSHAQELGVTTAVGLYQQLRKKWIPAPGIT